MSNISQNRRQTGTLFTCLTIFLTVLSALASCTSVLAGSFTTTYSGGALQGYGPYADYGTPGAYGKGSSNEGPAASDTSIITANFTWVPNPAYPTNDPEPKVVLIQQYSSSYWVDSDGYTVLGTGSCDNGLGSGITSTDAGYPSGSGIAGQTSAGYAYTLDSGDTISCTPSAIYEGIFGGCGVDYSAVPIPITISLGGAVQDSSGNWDILVGQQCTASVNGLPSGYIVTENWTVSGKTFTGWSPTVSLSGADPTTSSYTFVGAGQAATQTTQYIPPPAPTPWYWDDPYSATGTKETVTCKVSMVPQSASYPPIPGFTVTQNVTVMEPLVVEDDPNPNLDSIGQGGYMAVNSNDPVEPGVNLWASPTAAELAGNQPLGMLWICAVKTPASPAFGDGQIEVIQTIDPNNSAIKTANPALTVYDPNNGITCLDGQSIVYSSPVTEPAVIKDDDAPCIPLSKLNYAVNAASFVDYLMYMPPGINSTWVPVATLPWSCNGSATIPANGNWSSWTVTGSPSDKAGTVTPSGSVNFTASSSFPVWTAQDKGWVF
jgi:hypothetical protein